MSEMREDIGMEKERRKRKVIVNRIRRAAHVQTWKTATKTWRAKGEGKFEEGEAGE